MMSRKKETHHVFFFFKLKLSSRFT